MSVELHFKHASPVSGFMKVQNCALSWNKPSFYSCFNFVSSQEKGTTLLFQ